MGSAARNEFTSFIADARAPAAGGAFPYMMRQHANTIAKATVNGAFAAVPGLKNAARANFAGAPPPEETWKQIGDFPWQPVQHDRDWQQPYGAPPS
jgi:hypothetical protein